MSARPESKYQIKSLQVSQVQRFFIICQPGLEEQVIEDLKEAWPWLLGVDARPHSQNFPQIKIVEGGIEFDTILFMGLQLHFFLKTATRILLRLGSFRCRDLPKLFQKTLIFPWKNLLGEDQYSLFEVEATAGQSRLNNEKRVAQTVRESILKVLEIKAFKSPLKSSLPVAERNQTRKQAPTVLVRVWDDEVTMSLDLSGDPLYKRGWGIYKGQAPIRETLAHFLIAQLWRDTPRPALRAIDLIDPMCGSGTLLLEAGTYFRPLFYRDFLFFYYPFCPKIFRTRTWQQNYKNLPCPPLFAGLFGMDIDNEMVEICKKNFESAQLEGQFRDADLYFKTGTEKVHSLRRRNWVICNPPYGHRLNQKENLINRNKNYLLSWLEIVTQKYAPEKLGVIFPKDGIPQSWLSSGDEQGPPGWKIKGKFMLRNGGIPVVALILENQMKL